MDGLVASIFISNWFILANIPFQNFVSNTVSSNTSSEVYAKTESGGAITSLTCKYVDSGFSSSDVIIKVGSSTTATVNTAASEEYRYFINTGVGTSQINFNYDNKGNLFGYYGYSLSNIFQLELLNIGSFDELNFSDSKNKLILTGFRLGA